jgi:general secretion pathway protein C
MASSSFDQWISSTEEKIRPLLHRLHAVPTHYWQKLIIVTCVLWILFTIGFFVEQLLQNNSVNANVKKKPASAATATASSTNIETMVKWHLFGESDATLTTDPTTAVADDGSKDAGKTRLPIQLLGLMYATDEKQARAVLLINNDERQFNVGDSLPLSGNIKLHKVMVDRAIINNNGTLEALWLFDPDKARITRPRAPITPEIPIDPPEESPPLVENNQASSFPQSALQIVPAWRNDGKLQGYRITRGSNSAAFDALGFSDGDIVTKINDAKMDNPQNAIQLYQQLQRGGMATFEVIRDGQTITFDAELNQNSLFSPSQTGNGPPGNDGNQ